MRENTKLNLKVALLDYLPKNNRRKIQRRSSINGGHWNLTILYILRMNLKPQLKIKFFPFVTVWNWKARDSKTNSTYFSIQQRIVLTIVLKNTNSCSWSSCTINNWVVVQRITDNQTSLWKKVITTKCFKEFLKISFWILMF